MMESSPAGYPASLGAPRLDAAEEAPWLRAARCAAFERFEKTGLPTARDEQWRHTNIAPIAAAAFQPASHVNGFTAARERLESWGLPGGEFAAALIFINGRYAPELSQAPDRSLRAGSIRDSWRRNDAPCAERFGQALLDETQAFASINTAYSRDGAFVSIPADRIVSAPIYLVFVSTTEEKAAPMAAHPRSIIIAGRGSQASIVSVYGGTPGASYLTNSVTEIFVEDGAALEHSELQTESDNAFHVATLASRLGRDSRFVDRSFALGARLARREVAVRLDGAGGECRLFGLYLADGEQHLDAHTLIDHAQAHTSSREVYKGILAGRSRGVFHGRIVVRPDAQKIDAHQVNKNLIVSDEALANSTPQLQIQADDVRCMHASTTGQLDPISLFYLRSRGIDETMARNLLTYAFACEIVSGVHIPAVRAGLARLLQTRLPGAPTELCS